MKILLAILLVTFTAQALDVTNGNFKAAAPATEKPAPKSSTKQKSAAKARSTYPFYGALASADASSIILKGKIKNRPILVNSETRIERNGASATLADVTAGERVSGTVRKNADGK